MCAMPGTVVSSRGPGLARLMGRCRVLLVWSCPLAVLTIGSTRRTSPDPCNAASSASAEHAMDDYDK